MAVGLEFDRSEASASYYLPMEEEETDVELTFEHSGARYRWCRNKGKIELFKNDCKEPVSTSEAPLRILGRLMRQREAVDLRGKGDGAVSITELLRAGWPGRREMWTDVNFRQAKSALRTTILSNSGQQVITDVRPQSLEFIPQVTSSKADERVAFIEFFGISRGEGCGRRHCAARAGR